MLRSRRSFLVSSRSPRASWSAAVSLASVVATAPSSGEPVPTGRGGEPVKFRAPFRPPYELVFVHDPPRPPPGAGGRGPQGTSHRREPGVPPPPVRRRLRTYGLETGRPQRRREPAPPRAAGAPPPLAECSRH